MVSRSPNLEEFYRDEPPDLSENLLEGSSAAFVISCEFNPTLLDIPKGYAGPPVKMTNMNLHFPDSFCMQSFKRTVPRILQASFDTLHSLKIDLVFLVPLISSGISFKNVKHLSTLMDYADLEHEDPRIFSLLKFLDFTQTFPKLDKIEVREGSNSLDHVEEFMEEGMAAYKREHPLPGRAENIRHLRLLNVFTAKAACFLAGLFPNVETIYTAMIGGAEPVPYHCIWKHWLDLKELDVLECISYSEGIRSRNENLDSIFCGIFPKEVARLREQDDEYLRAVHIVPVRPSLACLRALRTFTLLRPDSDPVPKLHEKMKPLFSKVTALIAFQRCPNLSIKIRTGSNEIFEALDPLRPYLSVQLG